jgi:hypothetical protein
VAGDEDDGKGGTVDMLKKEKQDFKFRGEMRKSKSPKPSNMYKKWIGVRTFTPPSVIQLFLSLPPPVFQASFYPATSSSYVLPNSEPSSSTLSLAVLFSLIRRNLEPPSPPSLQLLYMIDIF